MKSPRHPVPSGDRTLARLLLVALCRAGHKPLLASGLRSYEGRGDRRQQQRIRRRAEIVGRRLLEHYRALPGHERPQLWFSYHLYHKAPDLLGPPISRALGIPYVVAEASHAPKQATGPWAAGFEAARDALLTASRIIALNPVDVACVNDLLDTGTGQAARVVPLAPFIDAQRVRRWSRQEPARQRLALELHLQPGIPVLICVAMMRSQAKLASYALLARALKKIEQRTWQLLIVGDGEAYCEVQTLFQNFKPSRVVFAGRQRPRRLAQCLGLADLLVWPAIDEAWGMVFLEAAAAGLPCVAGDAGGVAQVVAHERSGLLTAAGDADAFAAALLTLLDNPAQRQALAAGAAAKALAEHDLGVAARQLQGILNAI